MNTGTVLDMQWQEFNAALKDCDEQQLLKLMAREKKDRRRLAYLMRLYGRYSKLRTQRERFELVNVSIVGRTT